MVNSKLIIPTKDRNAINFHCIIYSMLIILYCSIENGIGSNNILRV